MPDFPRRWIWTKLEDLSEKINSGFSSGEHNKEHKGILHIRPMNISTRGKINLSSVKYVEVYNSETLLKGDVLFNNTNSPEMVGKTTYLKQDTDWAYSNHMTRIRLYKQFLEPAWVANYLHYLFLNGYFKMNCTHHVNQASINIAFLSKKVLIPLAPLNEQRLIIAKIEELFSQIDAGAETLQRIKIIIRSYQSAVLKAAIDGSLTAKWRRANPDIEPAERQLLRIQMKILDSNKKQNKISCDTSVDTIHGLPKLPDTWVWAKWKQIGISQNGRLFPSKEYRSDGIKLLRPGNLQSNGEVVWTKENTRYLPESWTKDHPSFMVGPRELVMNLTAQSLKDEFLGRLCITGPGERCLLNQRIARLSPTETMPEYILWVFKSPLFRKFVNSLNTGSLIQHMFTSQLDEFYLPLPPLEEQNHIISEIKLRFSVLNIVENTIIHNLQKAEILYRSILKHAFEGTLISQDPNDEPALTILKQIENEKANIKPKRTKLKKKMKSSPKCILNLYKVLVDSEDELTPDELFTKSGYTILYFPSFS